MIDPRWKAAAFLETQGLKRDEIGKAVGVAGKTISDWRTRQDYQDEVQRWSQQNLEILSAVFGRMQVELASVGIKALSTLSEAMDERDNEGHVTSRAVDAAGKVVNKLLFAIERQKGEAEAAATAQAAVIIVQRGGTDDITIIDQAEQVRKEVQQDGSDRG